MIIIGEKINGSIPSIKQAIADRDEELIRQRTMEQDVFSDYLDCAAGTEPAVEYETMQWLIGLMQSVSDKPLCIDSPDASMLAKIIESGVLKRPGMVNSVSLEGSKCETLLPLIAGTDWNVIGLCCDNEGIPSAAEKRLELAKRIIGKADSYGVALSNLHIDPCVMALSSTPSALQDMIYVIKGVHEFAPEVKVTAAVSNISFNMPARSYINSTCLAFAVEAGLDSAIMNPCSTEMRSVIYAAEALLGRDLNGRQYNRAYRKGIVGIKK